MEYLPSLALIVSLLLGTSVAGGTALIVAPGEEVTITGTVTGVDETSASDAVVLVGEDSTLTKFSPSELRDIATTNPQNLTVVAVDSNGHFKTTLGSLRAEAAVAVSDTGISDLKYIRGENATLEMQLYEQRPQTVHAHLGTVAADEQQADLYINLVNSGDTTIKNLSVSIGSLPAGWSITEVKTDGNYSQANRTLIWPSIAPDGEIDTTIVLTVPEGTPVGEYTIELHAASDTHLVSVAPETVEVLPEDTPGPTTTPPPTTDENSLTTDASETLTPTKQMRMNTSPTTESGSGFGAMISVTALLLMAILLVRDS